MKVVQKIIMKRYRISGMEGRPPLFRGYTETTHWASLSGARAAVLRARKLDKPREREMKRLIRKEYVIYVKRK
jgi:hypothetical protein